MAEPKTTRFHPQTEAFIVITHGLPPVACEQPKLLILGSLPGLASLRAQGYYQHPRNAFWPIVDGWLNVTDANQRQQALADAGIYLWDVLASAHRPGSLDANIRRQDAGYNDLQPILDQPSLQAVLLNGQSAAKFWQQGCRLGVFRCGCQQLTLPSTSPANAAMSLAQKQQAWQVGWQLVTDQHRPAG